MKDRLVKIMMTEEEAELLLLCIDTNRETIKRRDDAGSGINADLLQQLAEMDMDIREQVWNTEEARTSFTVAEDDFIKRGMDARELAKVNRAAAVSRAQERRDARLMKGTASPCVADFMNDPVDW